MKTFLESDIEIISEILQGDRQKFRILVDRYQSNIFRTCMGFVHNKEDADDLTQEVFIQAYQALTSFNRDASFSTWLYRIAVNASLNKLRRAKKNRFLQRIGNVFGSEITNAYAIPTSIAEDPENLLISTQRSEWVERALNSLPENQRTAIILSKYDELSQREIASIMETTEGAVEALIQRAKVNLRERLHSLNKKK